MADFRNLSLVVILVILAACGNDGKQQPEHVAVATADATTNVLTQRNDIARSGVNTQERVLHTRNVNQDTFGKLFSRAVDDELYAQLLIVSRLDMPGKGLRNVVFAATVSNSVYAFDADDPAESEPLWHINYTPQGGRPTRADDMYDACGGAYSDFSGNIGIVSTPVIDHDTTTMYFVTRTHEDGSAVQRFHAVDITDGRERENSPVVISASISGNGAGSVDGALVFEPLKHNQRASLLLLDGTVYIAWASHCDWGPFHGWLLGYNAATLLQEVVWNVTPDGAAGGIWQSGQGLSSVGTYIYAISGNGTVGEDGDRSSTRNRGQSILKLAREGNSLKVISWFTPYDWEVLEEFDWDLGSTGLLLIPGTRLGVAGGKGGKLYVVNVDDMGGLSSSGSEDDNIIQSFPLNAPSHLHSTPLYWDGPDGARVFTWAEKDYLKSFPITENSQESAAALLDMERVEVSRIRAPMPSRLDKIVCHTRNVIRVIQRRVPRNCDEDIPMMPGAFLALSSDGDTVDSAILWASMPFSGDANRGVRPGILRAFEAADVRQELWNSLDDGPRDDCGSFAKFASPTVANGKVYMGSFSRQLCVYGLLE